MAHHNSTTLPSYIGALQFASRCFGISEKQMRGVSRMQLARASRGTGTSEAERTRVERQLFTSLTEHFLSHGVAPVGPTNSFTDQLVYTLLSIYDKVRSKIAPGDASTQTVLRLLAEHVYVPTLYVMMAKFQHLGLGDELRGPNSWYFLSQDGVDRVTPIQRVLDCWMRVAGFRTAYGVSKMPFAKAKTNRVVDLQHHERWPARRKQLDRWLSGKVTPTIFALERLVDEFRERVSWLDDPVAWKARFRLAHALHTVSAKAGDLFGADSPLSSSRVVASLHQIESEVVARDSDGMLHQPDIFFATRLIQKNLLTRGVLEKIVAPARKVRPPKFGPNPSDHSLESYRAEIMRETNPGDWILRYLHREAEKVGCLSAKDTSLMAQFALREYIFDLGVAELNRLLANR